MASKMGDAKVIENDTTAIEQVESQNGDQGSAEEHTRIRRKVDSRLVVLLGFMYCVSLMDRSNLGNANAAGYVILCFASANESGWAVNELRMVHQTSRSNSHHALGPKDWT
jgi:hypothetical protein